MPNTTTTRLLLIKPEVGAAADTWGSVLNADLDSVDKLICAIATTGSANAYVLTTGQSLTAYATGQRFRIIPNFTCSGASTINVDSIGAKNLYKNVAGTPTAVASGDIVSGIPITATYDGTQFIVDVPTAAQPADATLTALAALSWSSLTPVIQFTAADTVSLTSNPKVTTLEIGDATTQTLGLAAGRAQLEGVDIVTTSSTDTLTNKTLTSPTINGGTGSLTLQLSGETSGTLTSASANKKILATGGITLPNSVFAAQQWIIIEGNGTARTITRGAGVTMYVAGTDSATATLTANGIMGVHWRTASICILTGNVS